MSCAEFIVKVSPSSRLLGTQEQLNAVSSVLTCDQCQSRLYTAAAEGGEVYDLKMALEEVEERLNKYWMDEGEESGKPGLAMLRRPCLTTPALRSCALGLKTHRLRSRFYCRTVWVGLSVVVCGSRLCFKLSLWVVLVCRLCCPALCLCPQSTWSRSSASRLVAVITLCILSIGSHCSEVLKLKRRSRHVRITNTHDVKGSI